MTKQELESVVKNTIKDGEYQKSALKAVDTIFLYFTLDLQKKERKQKKKVIDQKKASIKEEKPKKVQKAKETL